MIFVAVSAPASGIRLTRLPSPSHPGPPLPGCWARRESWSYNAAGDRPVVVDE